MKLHTAFLLGKTVPLWTQLAGAPQIPIHALLCPLAWEPLRFLCLSELLALLSGLVQMYWLAELCSPQRRGLLHSGGDINLALRSYIMSTWTG